MNCYRRLHKAVFLLILGLIAGSGTTWSQNKKKSDEDLFKMRGITVTKGAAPGYVPDKACAMCHTKLYRSYQNVGMARSFYKPKADTFIENFKKNVYYHRPSKRYYRIDRKGDTLTFKRYQLDHQMKEINVFTRKVDWIMGSGNHSRVYIYQSPSGELFQLPLAWYSQQGGFWAMSPGFDNKGHHGVARRVRRECMFCHNAYPDVAKGSDAFATPQIYPMKLPEGTGCQRCHGPGAEHIKAVLEGDFDSERIQKAIVNPKKLEPRLRNDVCFQCHMQPSVALFGIRRFGVTDYAFRPGQKMGDYLPHMDIVEEGKTKEERFEINHHPYRMQQSKCFTASKGKLSCLTCHNPHQKVAPEKRAAHYRNACLTCHQPKQCPENAKPANHTAKGDCVSCHMPMRRTQDVVNVLMTDHRIQRKPESKSKRFAPLKESVPIITDAQFLFPGDSPQGEMGKIYRSVSVLRAGGGQRAATNLKNLLQKNNPKEITPYLDMVRALLQQRKNSEAESLLNELTRVFPKHEQVMEWLGLVRIAQNNHNDAEKILKEVLTLNKNRVEIHYNLGLLYIKTRRFKEAEERLRKAVELRPALYIAWYHLGNVMTHMSKPDEAVKSFKRCLEVEPSFTRAYLSLGGLLIRNGKRAEAMRYLRHGLNVASHPDAIKKAMAKL